MGSKLAMSLIRHVALNLANQLNCFPLFMQLLYVVYLTKDSSAIHILPAGCREEQLQCYFCLLCRVCLEGYISILCVSCRLRSCVNQACRLNYLTTSYSLKQDSYYQVVCKKWISKQLTFWSLLCRSFQSFVAERYEDERLGKYLVLPVRSTDASRTRHPIIGN